PRREEDVLPRARLLKNSSLTRVNLLFALHHLDVAEDPLPVVDEMARPRPGAQLQGRRDQARSKAANLKRVRHEPNDREKGSGLPTGTARKLIFPGLALRVCAVRAGARAC